MDLVVLEGLEHHLHQLHPLVLEYQHFLLVRLVLCHRVRLFLLRVLEVRGLNLHFR